MPSSHRPNSLRDWLKAAQSLPDLPELRPALDDAHQLGLSDFTDSAVLVALIQGAEPGVLLTKRTSHLAKHAGQVSFPGGRRFHFRDPGGNLLGLYQEPVQAS